VVFYCVIRNESEFFLLLYILDKMVSTYGYFGTF
jgi:hypothetical protein